jgi:hypothetical protein
MKIKNVGAIILLVGLWAEPTAQAQGTTYVSNLGQTSTGSDAVGSDSWLAVEFETGNNSSGYTLNSVQLEMADSSGTSDGFTVMIYSSLNGATIPKTSVDSLNGPDNPSTAGIYTYTPATSLTLLPITVYSVVLTAATPVADGTYNLSSTDPTDYNPSGGWHSLGSNWTSSNGSSWNESTTIYPQFAINATAIPEPSACRVCSSVFGSRLD